MALPILVGLAAADPARAALGAGDTVRYRDDKLAVRLRDAPRDDVVQAIADAAGALLRGRAIESSPVTAEFDAVPVADGLHRLLGDQNFTLTYGKGGKLIAIRLEGGPGDAVTDRSPPSAGTSFLRAIDRRAPPVTISGRLAEVLGGPNATLRQLVHVAATNEEAPVRGYALAAALSTVESEPELRDELVAFVTSTDDAMLGTMVRGAFGNHTEEVLRQVEALARAPEVRAKAAALLLQLGAGASGD